MNETTTAIAEQPRSSQAYAYIFWWHKKEQCAKPSLTILLHTKRVDESAAAAFSSPLSGVSIAPGAISSDRRRFARLYSRGVPIQPPQRVLDVLNVFPFSPCGRVQGSSWFQPWWKAPTLSAKPSATSPRFWAASWISGTSEALATSRQMLVSSVVSQRRGTTCAQQHTVDLMLVYLWK